MSFTYQITIYAREKYRPVSTLIFNDSPINLSAPKEKAALLQRGFAKICADHGWSKEDVKRFGYTTGKVRLYDREKIEAENKARYEAIKEAKYASGEWKRPKKDNT